MKPYRVAVIGATGMVGQRFVSLLADHLWFDLTTVAASKRSAGRSYAQAVAGRWIFDTPVPTSIANLTVLDAAEVETVCAEVDFVFCAVDMGKAETKALEEAYARAETPVVSNNSANRLTPDVPMMIPELNPHHAAVIAQQRKRLGTSRGFITVKPNCSIQSYVPVLHPLLDFGLEKISVCTYQAISGASKTFASWPEMVDNVIPFIGGEEEKSEQEPLRIWGEVTNQGIVSAATPIISAQCLRVSASDGHMAAVSVSFKTKPDMDEMIARWRAFEPLPQKLGLPSAPKPFLKYFDEPDRPQTRLDRDFGNGMGVTIGRLRPDPILDYRFVALSHNTLRGAAGGGVLSAEYLCHEGYITKK